MDLNVAVAEYNRRLEDARGYESPEQNSPRNVVRSTYFDNPAALDGLDRMSNISNDDAIVPKRNRADMVGYNPAQEEDATSEAVEPDKNAQVIEFVRRQQKIRRAKRRRRFIAHERDDELSDAGFSTEDELDAIENEEIDEQYNEETLNALLRTTERQTRKQKCLVCKLWLIDPTGSTFIGRHVKAAMKLVENGADNANLYMRISGAVTTINKKVIEQLRARRINMHDITSIDFMRHYGLGNYRGRPCVVNDEILYETSLADLEYAKAHLKSNCVFTRSVNSGEKGVDGGNMKLMMGCINLQLKAQNQRRTARDAKHKAERANKDNEPGSVEVGAQGTAMALTGNGVVAGSTLSSLSGSANVPAKALYLMKKTT